MSKIIVLGAGGQLGQCLKVVAEARNINDVFFAGEVEANILDIAALDRLFKEQSPAYVINCAAYTAVDKAEEESEKAALINNTGAANLAAVCNDNQVILIHISTDFVFEGNVVKLLTEEDPANPVSVYGQTKLDGEKSIAAVLDHFFVLRTSWLYSEYASNFVKTMIKLGSERSELNIVADQVGTPTYAVDLANVIYDIISSGSTDYGWYHYSNEGVTSWYDFARTIFELSEMDVKVNPIPSSAYPTKARRPLFSVMDKSKIKNTFNLEIPYWRDSLQECLKRIQHR